MKKIEMYFYGSFLVVMAFIVFTLILGLFIGFNTKVPRWYEITSVLTLINATCAGIIFVIYVLREK